VVVRGVPKFEDLQTLKHGVHLMEGVAKVKDVDLRRRHKDSAELLMVLDEGKNREIRRMLAKIGHKVVRLVRVAIGPLNLGDLPPGAHRRLTGEEVLELKDWAERVVKGLAPKSLLKSKPHTPAKPAHKGAGSRSHSNSISRHAEGSTPHPDAAAKTAPSREAQRRSRHRSHGDGSSAAANPGDAPGGRQPNPVAEKIASGRPIHLEDLQRSQEIRRSQARPAGKGRPSGTAPRSTAGQAKSGSARQGTKLRPGGKGPSGGKSRPAGAASRTTQGSTARHRTGRPGTKVSQGRKRR
jgi:23S rRNA pseudouridine2605 synthase